MGTHPHTQSWLIGEASTEWVPLWVRLVGLPSQRTHTLHMEVSVSSLLSANRAEVPSNKAVGCCKPLADLRRGVLQPVAGSNELRQESLVSPCRRDPGRPLCFSSNTDSLELLWTKFASVLLLPYRGKDISYPADLLGQNIWFLKNPIKMPFLALYLPAMHLVQ